MKRSNTLLVFLCGMVLGTVIMLGIEAVRPQPDTLQKVYGSYMHVKMYEDGSYIGETIDGVAVSGCIEAALCND